VHQAVRRGHENADSHRAATLPSKHTQSEIGYGLTPLPGDTPMKYRGREHGRTGGAGPGARGDFAALPRRRRCIEIEVDEPFPFFGV